MNKLNLLALVALLFAFLQPLKAQEDVLTTNSATTTLVLGVSEAALLKSTTELINLQLNAKEAGEAIETSDVDSTARIRISSVISTNNTRTLSAKVTSGVVPTGTHLEVSVMQPNSNFVGETGVFLPSVVLDGTDRPIINNIATCYSGTGSDDGYPVRFVYALDASPTSYGEIRATAGTQIMVTFTLTAVQ